MTTDTRKFDVYSKKQKNGCWKSWEKESKIVVSGKTKQVCLENIKKELEEWLMKKEAQTISVTKASEMK